MRHRQWQPGATGVGTRTKHVRFDRAVAAEGPPNVGIYIEGEAPPTAHVLLWVCMLVWASASRRARTLRCVCVS